MAEKTAIEKKHFAYDMAIEHTPGNKLAPAEVMVGNTGLFLIRQMSGEWQLHFFPDGYKEAVSGKEKEFALRFLGGLQALLGWWASEENPYSQESLVTVAANTRFYNFLKKNLPGMPELIYEDNDHEMFLCELDFDQLREDEKIMANLEKAQQSLKEPSGSTGNLNIT